MSAFGRTINPSDLGAMDASRQNPVMRLFNGYEAFEWFGRCRVPAGVNTASFAIHRFDGQRSIEPSRALVVPANALITSLGFYFDDADNGNRALTHATAAGRLKLATVITANTGGLFLSSPAASSNVLANIPYSPTLTNAVFNITPVSVGASDVTYQLFATDGNATEGSAAASSVTIANRDLEIIVWVSGLLRRIPTPAEVNKRNEGVLWS